MRVDVPPVAACVRTDCLCQRARTSHEILLSWLCRLERTRYLEMHPVPPEPPIKPAVDQGGRSDRVPWSQKS